jgi:simple sugar transport system permease protein
VPPEATLVVKAAVVLVVSVIQSATIRALLARHLQRVLPAARTRPIVEASE